MLSNKHQKSSIVKSKTSKVSEERAIRIIEFSGKQSDWDGWSEKFLAKAEMKRY